ncbi:MAG: hypothetical protein Q9204_006568 [Flavoplaca sp. TL-2023a]
MSATVQLRQLPVKLVTPTKAYVPNIYPPESSSTSTNITKQDEFRVRVPGWGSRHHLDNAPFDLWDSQTKLFRDPTHQECIWISKQFHAEEVYYELPDIVVKTTSPPTQIPLTLGSAPCRFIPPGMIPPHLPLGKFAPYPTSEADIMKDITLSPFTFPDNETCIAIIDNLSTLMDIRAVHFLPPMIVVELNVSSNREYQRFSLPKHAGGWTLWYHKSPQPYWKESFHSAYQRLITPTAWVNDDSNYLFPSSQELCPGVCVSSSLFSQAGGLATLWRSTTAGTLWQKGTTRLLTVASHGFASSNEVYHPTPSGRRIGEIVQKIPAWDIGLVRLDPSINFDNTRYFQAYRPQRLISSSELMAGDWFELDSMATGRIDLMARGKSWINPLGAQHPLNIPVGAREWEIHLDWSVFGTVGGASQVQEGVCGAPLVDHDGRVAGYFSLADVHPLAHTRALDFFIADGWSLA